MTRLVALSFLILCSSIVAVSQQAANATLTGTVIDQLGAAIPSARLVFPMLGRPAITTRSEG